MKEQTNNQITRWMKITIEISIIIFAVGIAWTTLRGTVKQNTASIDKHSTRIEAVEEEVSDTQADIREIKVEQKYISKGIEEIKESLK